MPGGRTDAEVLVQFGHFEDLCLACEDSQGRESRKKPWGDFPNT